MAYKVVGKLIHDGEVFGHGESVSASKVGGQENFDALVAAKSVVSADEFKTLFPEQDGEVIDATGTPSNLREVEGTKLQANMPKDEGAKNGGPDGSDNPTPPNPANPPEVKGAGNAKAAEKEQQKQADK